MMIGYVHSHEVCVLDSRNKSHPSDQSLFLHVKRQTLEEFCEAAYSDANIQVRALFFQKKVG
jgi:hypothetical protein